MPNMKKMKFKIWEQMFSKWDMRFGLAMVIALVFSILAINKEPVFGYMRNAHELNYAEQMMFSLDSGIIQCGVLSEKINSLVLIPEVNEETGDISRYLLIINYTLTNLSDEEQKYKMRCMEKGKWNGEDCYVELAGYVDLSEDFTAKKKDSGYIEANETTEECYYALWIYTEYDEDAYYSISLLDMEKPFQIGIGLQNDEEERFTMLGF